MPIITSLFMNLLVASTAFLLTYRVFKFSGFIDSLLAFSVFYFSQIVYSELLLGLTGTLYLKNLIAINMAVLLIIWFLGRSKDYYFELKNPRDTLLEIISNKTVLLIIAVLVGFGLVKFFINLVNPPFGWDDLNYHFTFPVEWLKHGNLNNPITIFDDPSPSYYPINGSLLFFWLILPLKNVFLADLGQLPFFILAVLAAYGLARKMGLNKELSFSAAGLFFLVPNFFKQLKIAYIDVMVAALFLIALNYLFLLRKEFSLRNILIYSMGLGLLLGTKTIALPYSLLLFAPFVYYVAKNLNKAYLLLISLVAIISLGGFTYIRNFLEVGNPLYPLNLKVMGIDIFKGAIDNSIYAAHFKQEDFALSKLLFHEGLGAGALIFIFPAVFLSLPLALLKRRKGLHLILAYSLLLPLLIYLAYRFVIPLPNSRYLYPLLGVGLVCGFYTARLLNIPKLIINILTGICVLASIPELARRQELVVSLVLAAALFFLLPYLIKFLPRLFAPSIIVILLGLVILNNDYIKNEYPRYIKMERYSGFWPDATRAWYLLNNNTSGNNIAYAGRPVPFPLYGSSFKNNVYYVSVNSQDPAKLHYFQNSRYIWSYDFKDQHKNLEEQGNYRSGADYNIWLTNLLKRNTDYLFIYSLHQTKDIEFPLEDNWAKSNPGKFNQVFANNTIRIYKVLR
ncbi:MAG: hypothetical protein V2A59_03760 [Candidatus Omnitrophota bacterium]